MDDKRFQSGLGPFSSRPASPVRACIRQEELREYVDQFSAIMENCHLGSTLLERLEGGANVEAGEFMPKIAVSVKRCTTIESIDWLARGLGEPAACWIWKLLPSTPHQRLRIKNRQGEYLAWGRCKKHQEAADIPRDMISCGAASDHSDAPLITQAQLRNYLTKTRIGKAHHKLREQITRRLKRGLKVEPGELVPAIEIEDVFRIWSPRWLAKYVGGEDAWRIWDLAPRIEYPWLLVENRAGREASWHDVQELEPQADCQPHCPTRPQEQQRRPRPR